MVRLAPAKYEYAALVLNGDCSLEGQPLQERALYYLGANRSGGVFHQPGRVADYYRSAVRRSQRKF